MTAAKPPLNFARLVLELHRRSGGGAGLVNHLQLDEALEGLSVLAARSDTTEAVAVRLILAAAVGAHRELVLEGRAIESLTPETIWCLDAVLTALVDGTMSREDLRSALRRVLIRPAN